MLPALVMAVFGFVSLRQDRLLARLQATEEAERLAADLVHQPLLETWIPGRLPAPADEEQSAAWHDEMLRRLPDRDRFRCAVTDRDGVLLHPPPLRWPEPDPLEPDRLDPGQRDRWLAARRLLFQAEAADPARESFESLIGEGLPARFEALARWHLLHLALHTGQPLPALEQLERIRRRFGAVRTEAGFPLVLLAEWRWLQTIAPAAGLSPVALEMLDGLGAHAVFEPGPLSETLLETLRRLATDPASAARARVWLELWETFQRDRRLVASVQDARLKTLPPAPAAFHGWIEFEEVEHLVLCRETDRFILWLAVERGALEDHLRQAIDALALPPYLACSIELAGKPLGERAPAGTALGTAARPVHRTTGPELAATVWLAQPDRLYARQRKRTWWFGMLIAVSAGSVLTGALAAWRGFLEQQRLTEMKSSFVSSVSHEMRAPIAAVRLMAEELVDRGPEDAVKADEYHGYILQECRRLSTLIENVLDFSRHEQGRKQYRIEPTDLLPVVEDTLHVMRSLAASRQVTLDRRLEGEPFDVPADPVAIQQVLVNLLDNAIKHSPPGATVEVALTYPQPGPAPTPADGSRANGSPAVQLAVRDRGPGIPDDEQERIFERFYRRGSELRRETQGIGLGLTIVQYIARAHGGRVRVESRVGEGSRFILELPVAESVPV